MIVQFYRNIFLLNFMIVQVNDCPERTLCPGCWWHEEPVATVRHNCKRQSFVGGSKAYLIHQYEIILLIKTLI
jgi:hypothetical protein